MGYLLVILASLLFGTYPSAQNAVLQSGVSPIMLVVIVNGTCALTALAFARGRVQVSGVQLRDLALIGAIGLYLTDLFLNISYMYIPVGFTTMIHFCYPALVCLIMVLFFHKRMTRLKGLAILFSIGGMVLLTGSGFQGKPVGIFTALITAFAYSFYMIGSEHLSARDVPLPVFVFYTNLFVECAAIPSLLIQHAAAGTPLTLPGTPLLWFFSILSAVGLFCAQLCINAGIKRIGAGSASFINMVEPVTSLVFSALVFHYRISPLNICGCLLIVCALGFIARNDAIEAGQSSD